MIKLPPEYQKKMQGSTGYHKGEGGMITEDMEFNGLHLDDQNYLHGILEGLTGYMWTMVNPDDKDPQHVIYRRTNFRIFFDCEKTEKAI